MKRFLLFFYLCLFTTYSSAVMADQRISSLFGIGVGTEYGGLGVQAYIPLKFKDIEFFLSTGLAEVSTSTGEQLGYGVGTNYFLNEKSAIVLYVGTLDFEHEDDIFTKVKSNTIYGGSIGYRYFFNKGNASGLSVGGTYNIHKNGSYPFLSLGYRF